MTIDVFTIFIAEACVSLLLSRTIVAHLQALVRRVRNALSDCSHVAIES
jgi:hypothetical protein